MYLSYPSVCLQSCLCTSGVIMVFRVLTFFFFFFFFQAEDGIRDSSVTGVQTCALPIFAIRRNARSSLWPPPSPDSCAPPSLGHRQSHSSDCRPGNCCSIPSGPE